MTKTVGRVLVACGGALLGLLVAEVAVRTLADLPEYAIYEPHYRAVLHPDPRSVPGVSGDARFTVNSVGVRGDELPTGPSYRILALGGSTTECGALDDAETWPRLLQERLDGSGPDGAVWVGNGGKSGLSTREHRLQVSKLSATSPRIDALVLLVGANDLLLRLRAGDAFRPLWELSEEDRELLLERAFHVHPRERAGSELWRRVVALRDARARRGEAVDVSAQVGGLYDVLRARRSKARRASEAPDLSVGLEEYRRNVHAIADAAEERGTRLVLLTQPMLWRPDLPDEARALLWMGAIEAFPKGRSYLEVGPLAEAMERYNQTLLAVCRERALECVDLAAAIPRDRSSFYDDLHFTEAGARRVADVLAEHFLAAPPLRGGGATGSSG